MTQKMTDEMLETWRNQTPSKVWYEAKRARAEEDEKDIVIKALADALYRSGWVVGDPGEWHSRHCPQGLPPAAAPCTIECEADRAALRAAGRLK